MKKTNSAKPKSPSRSFQSPKGMHDILPQRQYLWDKMRKELKSITSFYGYQRIDTPLVEASGLFERSVGGETDIVEKEMFTVIPSSRGKLVLRPEGTAPVVRAYIEHGLSHLGQPLKLYYEGPMFRHEKPQAGRFRQFHQIGFEVLGGEDDPVYDVQVILAAYRYLEELKLQDLSVRVNSIGCKTCRSGYTKVLQSYYKNSRKKICNDCKRRLSGNPLRLLDCKEEECHAAGQDAPIFVDYVCKACHDHFRMVLEYLEELKLPYVLDHSLVRGFDYYSKTVFEIVSGKYDSSLAGGGRYDYLIELLGGKGAPAVGAALGMERIVAVMEVQKRIAMPKSRPKVFFVYIGDLARKKGLVLIEELRRARIDVAESLGRGSLKGQLRLADKADAPLAIIFGQKEAFEESIIVRDLSTGAQETVPLTKLVESVKRKLK